MFETGVFIVEGLKYPILVLDTKSFIFLINSSNVFMVDNVRFPKLLFRELGTVGWYLILTENEF